MTDFPVERQQAEKVNTTARRSEQSAGVLAMAGCAILWSLSGVFIKLIDWQPFAIAGGRSLVAALFLQAVVRKKHFSFSRVQIASALAYAITMILFVSTLR